MTKPNAVPFINKIQMGVDLDDVNWLFVVKRIDAGNVDRMVPAHDNWQCTCSQYLAHTEFDIRVALYRVRMNDVRIADIDDPCPGRIKIGDVVFEIVSTGMPEREQR